ncbi:MAG: threonine--tRNA ligase [archaeon]
MKKSSEKYKKVKEEKIDLKQLQNKLTKIKMSAPKGKNNLKSNVELGRDLDLYVVSDVVGSGLPLLTPKGATIKREIERFITDEELKRGYLHTATPFMAKSDLYKISGHWQHYKEDMFVMNIHGEDFALRPMTCPFHFVLFKRKSRSYKELPLKYAEISTLFRNEKSGELRGLTRVRQMTLADAHILCTPSQLEEEFAKVLDLIKFSMEKLGVNDTWFRFSKWDSKNKEKYVNNPEAWESTEKLMKKILDKLKLKYVEAKGEAAFYGPKLDLQYKDVYGKEDTLFTVQIDFVSPEKFNLSYKNEKGKEEKVMVIHRSSTGTTERTMAHILELTQGNLKTWLSPIQVKVLSMTSKNVASVEKLHDELLKKMIRVEIDERDVPVQKKVHDAQVEKVPYMVTLGEKEEKSKTLAVRTRDGKVEFNVKPEIFAQKIKKEIEERR